MGTSDFAVPTLARLVDVHEVICVYTQPPRPAGRGQKARRSPIENFAAVRRLLVRTPKSFKLPEAQRDFILLKADAAVVVSYGLILPKALLAGTKYGCFNVHGSLLPRWRGAAPIQRAIMAGDVRSGVTIMHMEEGLDTGPVLATHETSIDHMTTAGDLHDRLSIIGAKSLGAVLRKAEAGTLVPKLQYNKNVTYAEKIQNAEARIDFNRPAPLVARHIHGLSPFPGAYVEHKGERIRVLVAEVVDAFGPTGEVLDNRLTVGCSDGAVRFIEVQRSGRRRMSTEDFLRGNDLPKGALFTANVLKLD